MQLNIIHIHTEDGRGGDEFERKRTSTNERTICNLIFCICKKIKNKKNPISHADVLLIGSIPTMKHKEFFF